MNIVIVRIADLFICVSKSERSKNYSYNEMRMDGHELNQSSRGVVHLSGEIPVASNLQL